MIILEEWKGQPITTAVFDFDGTLSTLRCGWESVMEDVMSEILYAGAPTEEQRAQIRAYIHASGGIQTILQMKWICEQLRAMGREPRSPWDYKEIYNRRLMETVAKRRQRAALGNEEAYLIQGSREFLALLRGRGVKLYAASGTDDADVKKEAELLGLSPLFDEIAGAKPYSEDCSKEATLKRLIDMGRRGGLLVVGDGPVEIRLGREFGAVTLGVAAKERQRSGFDETKMDRLRRAGAHALCDGFAEAENILNCLEGRK